MRYEVKIGILALIAIVASVWGYKYIQGSNLFSNSNYYEVYYENVSGLTVGTPVQISGVNVGSVSDIYLNQAESNRVEVTLDVNDDINIPKTTKAFIAADGVLGGKLIMLNFKSPCLGTGDCAEDGDILEGASLGMLQSFLGGDPEVNPADGFNEKLNGIIDSLQYIFFSPDSDNPVARSSQDLAATMDNLKNSTARLQYILESNTGEINATMKNLADLTTTLAAKQETIAGIIDNTENLTDDLAKMELQKTMTEVNKIVTSLQGTLGKADTALGGVTTIMNDVNEGKGTLGKLLKDDGIYNRLNSASLAADTLFTDLQERPYRYVPFKSRKKVLRFDRKDADLETEGARDFKAVEKNN